MVDAKYTCTNKENLQCWVHPALWGTLAINVCPFKKSPSSLSNLWRCYLSHKEVSQRTSLLKKWLFDVQAQRSNRSIVLGEIFLFMAACSENSKEYYLKSVLVCDSIRQCTLMKYFIRLSGGKGFGWSVPKDYFSD